MEHEDLQGHVTPLIRVTSQTCDVSGGWSEGGFGKGGCSHAGGVADWPWPPLEEEGGRAGAEGVEGRRGRGRRGEEGESVCKCDHTDSSLTAHRPQTAVGVGQMQPMRRAHA